MPWVLVGSTWATMSLPTEGTVVHEVGNTLEGYYLPAWPRHTAHHSGKQSAGAEDVSLRLVVVVQLLPSP